MKGLPLQIKVQPGFTPDEDWIVAVQSDNRYVHGIRWVSKDKQVLSMIMMMKRPVQDAETERNRS